MPKADDSYEVKTILRPWEYRALEERVRLCGRGGGRLVSPDRAQVIRVAILDYIRSRSPDTELDRTEERHRVALRLARGIQ